MDCRIEEREQGAEVSAAHFVERGANWWIFSASREANAPDFEMQFDSYCEILWETAKIFHESVEKRLRAWYNLIVKSCVNPQNSQ